MTKFLEDEVYLAYMDERAEQVLEEANSALERGDHEKASMLVASARKMFEPSSFYQAHKEDFERIKTQSQES
jgi:hypothetical protein